MHHKTLVAEMSEVEGSRPQPEFAFRPARIAFQRSRVSHHCRRLRSYDPGGPTGLGCVQHPDRHKNQGGPQGPWGGSNSAPRID